MPFYITICARYIKKVAEVVDNTGMLKQKIVIAPAFEPEQ